MENAPLYLALIGAFVLLMVFNVFLFRFLQKKENGRVKDLEQEHLDNIHKWKEYAVCCNKFQDGECDLSIPCDSCKHFKEPEKHEQKSQ